MKGLKTLLLLFLSINLFSQTISINGDDESKNSPSKNEYLFTLDNAIIQDIFQFAPNQSETRSNWVNLQLFDAYGEPLNVKIAEAPVAQDELYNRYPDNKSFKLTGDNVSGRLSITKNGLHGLVFVDGIAQFIEQVSDNTFRTYISNARYEGVIECGVDHIEKAKTHTSSENRMMVNVELKEYIIAIASSGEWSNERGNDLAVINADIMIYLNELNAIYEKDLAITFTLTENNDDIIFFDPVTDGINPNNRLPSAQSVISSNISSSEYDLGHVFYEIPYSGGGWTGSGVASLGVVCNNSVKARGWTGCGGNYPVDFFMDIFAHEVGHQFDAYHTFYGTSGNCAPGNRSPGHGVEPGSGNTLMSYEGTCNGSCGNQNITPYASTLYFHAFSIQEISDFVATTSCANTTTIANSIPVVTAPSNYTIPKGTPFVLSGSATDADGDDLVYVWEEMDTDNLNLSCPNGAPEDAANSTTAPLFRSYDPTAGGNTRYFPKLENIANGTTPVGEILPQVSRDIEMRLTARDQNSAGGGVGHDDVVLTVAGNAGPFEVNTGNSPTTYTGGATISVSWDVANTNTSPVSCSNVKISLSIDGGNTFPITLEASTPNDGAQSIVLPDIGTTEGRIMVEAIGNIFFDVNNDDITIISECEPVSLNIINDETIIADEGDPELLLNLYAGNSISSVTGTLNSSDPSMALTMKDGATGGCTSFSNYAPKYETFQLMGDATGSYNFVSSAPFFEFVNFFSPEFVPANTCTNWFDSNITLVNGQVQSNSNFNVDLNAFEVFEITFSGFGSGDTGAFSLNFSNSIGANLYVVSSSGGYQTSFVAIDDNDIIKRIDPVADLTDENIFSGGLYYIYALNHIENENFDNYIGLSFAQLQADLNNGTICGLLGENQKDIIINGCTPSTKTVTSSSDNGGSNTLRTIAENACPGDEIVFSASLDNATITLNSEIIIDKDVTISGPSNGNLKLSGGLGNRIFNVQESYTLTLNNIELRNGYSVSNGGAFLNNGNVILDQVDFVNNFESSTPKAFTNLGSLIFVGDAIINE